MEYAISNTPKRFLEQNIIFNTMSHTTTISDSRKKQYGATLGETAPQTVIDELQDGVQDSSVNNHLFDSIGDSLNFQIPQVELSDKDAFTRRKTNTQSTIPTNRVVSFIPPQIEETAETTALDKNILNKFIFLIPVVVLLIGIVFYFVVLPKLYGNAVSFVDWLFTDPQNIINALHNPNVVLSKTNGIIGMKLFWWIWLSGLVTSLYLLRK